MGSFGRGCSYGDHGGPSLSQVQDQPRKARPGLGPIDRYGWQSKAPYPGFAGTSPRGGRFRTPRSSPSGGSGAKRRRGLVCIPQSRLPREGGERGRLKTNKALTQPSPTGRGLIGSSPRPPGGEGWVRGITPTFYAAFPANAGLQMAASGLCVCVCVPACAGNREKGERYFPSIASNASKITSIPAPAFDPSTVKTRRQVRAPLRPWNRPSMWRVMWASGTPVSSWAST